MLVTRGTVGICDKCLRKGIDLLLNTKLPSKRVTDPLPDKIHSELDALVIGQEEVKRIIAVSVHNHFKRISSTNTKAEIAKSNILLIGPTGSGKTLLAKTMAKFLRVPFTIADATNLTEAGYVGEDVESILQKLLQVCDYNPSRAQLGIIYIDEIDKLSRKHGNPSTRDISGEGVQQALLKMLEGTEVAVPLYSTRKCSESELVIINTTNILFICGGSFEGLEGPTDSKLTDHLGFGTSTSRRRRHRYQPKRFTTSDLIRFGLIPELVGRLPTIGTLQPLTEWDLTRILTEPKNALVSQYELLTKMEDANLIICPSALKVIAKRAMAVRTGARALRSILEGLLVNVMYDLPSTIGVAAVIADGNVLCSAKNVILIFQSLS